ncbi:hypothetical protein GGQ74_000725 [Desulfobaculum xiamenense]|uniref:Uncharacterized protein n=1 Tax=Desulfobaculum xiamenense TaxID=995050 RepID=A0A846QNV3_9BACT|nr:hypothetical protein [Desulfobaculum xiamenense]NJB67085.1 hypothetical protein [Desulfobaculum xiamenense]
MSFKIAAILNKPEREAPTMDAIRTHLEREAPDCEMRTFAYNDADYMRRMIAYAPNALVSFPYTARTTSVRSYVLKHIFGCFNLCLRTEGQLDYRNANKNTWLVGMENYGPDFVDYEMFWSRKIAELTGQELVRTDRLSSSERIRVFGYPPYEVHFRPWDRAEDTLPAHHAARLDARPRSHVALFITNFCFADYSAQDIVNAGDLIDVNAPDAGEELAAGIEGARRCGVFRQMWIDAILRAAYRNPHALIVVKSHPVEHIIFGRKGHNPYAEAFSRMGNIVYVSEPVRIVDLLVRAGLFLHYGSTCLAEACLQGVPSVFVTSEELYGEGRNPANPNFYFHDSGWESTLRADIAEIPELISRHIAQPMPFVMTERMRTVLLDVFNIETGHLDGTRPYVPSADIARFLAGLQGERPQRLAYDDPHLRSALASGRFVALDALVHAGVAHIEAGEHKAALDILNRAVILAGPLGVEVPALEELRAVCMNGLGLGAQAARLLAAKRAGGGVPRNAKNPLPGGRS